MITLLVGSPGHGKSYTLVRMIDEAVAKNQPVVTNVPLRDDWATVMAKRHTLLGPFRKKAVTRKAKELAKLVHVTDDLREILRVRLAGAGEGRGKMILDESHREMNSRTWASEKGARKVIIDGLSAHRHWGFDVVLATQAEGNLDAQVRSLVEFRAEVRNFKKLPWFILPINIFLRVTRWNDRAKTKAGISLYFLSRGLANLYHTHSLEGKDWPDDAIMLPKGSPLPESAVARVAERRREKAGIVVPGRPTRLRNVRPEIARDVRDRYTMADDVGTDTYPEDDNELAS